MTLRVLPEKPEEPSLNLGHDLVEKPPAQRGRGWAVENWPAWMAPTGLLLVAMVVRAWQLTFHSLWLDEAFSLFWANKPAAEIIRVGLALTEDKHPPLYYLLLHGWTGLFGTGDVAVRSLGVLLGAIAVLPVYGIARQLCDGSRRAALLAGLFVALNPFLVWYSQEARMFGPATTFGLIGLYAWLRLLVAETHQQRPGRALVWVFAAAAGLLAACYSYLFAAFLLPVAGVWWLLALARPPALGGVLPFHRQRIAWTGILTLVVTVVFLLPLAWSAWQVAGSEAQPGQPFANLGGNLVTLFEAYTLRQVPWSSSVVTLASTVGGLALVLGLVVGRRGLYLLTWLVLPLLIGNLLLARDGTVFAETRYFIFLAPAVAVTWAQAIDWLWNRGRVAGLAAALALVGMTLLALPYVWHSDPAYRREDWRTAAAYLNQYAAPRDQVVVHVDYARLPFDRYYSGRAPVSAPFGTPLSSEDQVAAGLDPLAAQADTLWLVLSHQEGSDPANLVRAWLGGRFPLVTEQYPAGIAVRGYAAHYRLPALPASATAVNVPSLADGQLRLAGCQLDASPVPATDEASHPPSGWTHVTLYWQALAPLADDDQAVVQLVDDQGQVWGASLERPDSTLSFYPMTRWQVGEVVRDDYDVNLNPEVPAGEYRINVQLRQPDGTMRKPAVSCGHVTVQR